MIRQVLHSYDLIIAGQIVFTVLWVVAVDKLRR